MKAVSVLLLALVMVMAGCSAGDNAGEAQAEQTQDTEMAAEVQGAPITVEESTDIETLLAHPDEYLGKTVLIEGKVMGRCSGSGCWVSLDRGPDAEGLIVQAEDKSFIFPEKCVGKEIAVQGTLMLRNAEEMAKEEEHAEGEADHVCPNPEYFFAPTGMKITA